MAKDIKFQRKRTNNKMTHKEMIDKSAKWLKRHTNNCQIANCPTVLKDLVSLNNTGEIPDIIGFSYCYSVLIEVKTSRSDFKKDFKKKFRKNPDAGMGQFRYYCCPPGLIMDHELPENWGLLYCNEKGKINTIFLAKKVKANIECERTMLISHIRRKRTNN